MSLLGVFWVITVLIAFFYGVLFGERMTERFTLTNPKNFFQEMKCGIDDRGNTLTFNEVVDMLNVFNDENEKLKSENKILKENLEHCANQFTDDGKNLLLSLRDEMND